MALGNASGLEESRLFVVTYDGTEVVSLGSFNGTEARLAGLERSESILNTNLHLVSEHLPSPKSDLSLLLPMKPRSW